MWNFSVTAKDRTYSDLTLSNLKHAIFERFSANEAVQESCKCKKFAISDISVALPRLLRTWV